MRVAPRRLRLARLRSDERGHDRASAGDECRRDPVCMRTRQPRPGVVDGRALGPRHRSERAQIRRRPELRGDARPHGGVELAPPRKRRAPRAAPDDEVRAPAALEPQRSVAHRTAMHDRRAARVTQQDVHARLLRVVVDVLVLEIEPPALVVGIRRERDVERHVRRGIDLGGTRLGNIAAMHLGDRLTFLSGDDDSGQNQIMGTWASWKELRASRAS
mmetsp:Transcript_2607/g.10028  ORF Transcript_2607/g.10028 Transcript_2607/m.10028 type:complete len:217 (+) Transcript_2607:268-918(+)